MHNWLHDARENYQTGKHFESTFFFPHENAGPDLMFFLRSKDAITAAMADGKIIQLSFTPAANPAMLGSSELFQRVVDRWDDGWERTLNGEIAQYSGNSDAVYARIHCV